jgi:PKD repeat protein
MPIVFDFYGTPVSGNKPLTVNFSVVTVFGNLTSWNWTFGDGSTSNLQNPSHTYTQAGLYSVGLTANSSFATGNVTKSSYVEVTSTTAIENKLWMLYE